MTKSRFLPFLVLTLLLSLSSTAVAFELGALAPSLNVSDWVKGDPVKLEDGRGKDIYVLVFWESGCGVCRDILPWLTGLQRKFRDGGVVLMCISVEPTTVVKSFVESLGSTNDLIVACDDHSKTYNDYMTAFSKSIVPYAFVVDKKGTLAWHGYPLAGLDKAIEEMVAGKFDLDLAKRVDNADRLQREYFRLASNPEKVPREEELGSQIVNDGASNPWLLNNFAWAILTSQEVKNRDYDLALRAVKRAYQASGGTDSAFADTYARALFEKGKAEEAVQIQKRAIETCKDPRYLPSLKEALKKYEVAAEGKGK